MVARFTIHSREISQELGKSLLIKTSAKKGSCQLCIKLLVYQKFVFWIPSQFLDVYVFTISYQGMYNHNKSPLLIEITFLALCLCVINLLINGCSIEIMNCLVYAPRWRQICVIS